MLLNQIRWSREECGVEVESGRVRVCVRVRVCACVCVCVSGQPKKARENFTVEWLQSLTKVECVEWNRWSREEYKVEVESGRVRGSVRVSMYEAP